MRWQEELNYDTLALPAILAKRPTNIRGSADKGDR
jgi:hypothetical protein